MPALVEHRHHSGPLLTQMPLKQAFTLESPCRPLWLAVARHSLMASVDAAERRVRMIPGG